MSLKSFAAKNTGPAMRRIVMVIGAAAMLAGCQTYSAQQDVLEYPNDYRKRHPITLKEAEHTVQIFVGTSRGSLTAAQRAEVLAFAQSWKDESSGGVVIDLPAAGSNAYAASDALREIRSILAAAGVPRNAVSVRPYGTPPTKLASIRLNYPRITAQTGPCGLWPQDLGPSADPAYFANLNYWNLGCASQRNLAAMVANPADLVQPRSESPVYNQRRTYVLEQYRKGAKTEATYPSADKGKLSDVGR